MRLSEEEPKYLSRGRGNVAPGGPSEILLRIERILIIPVVLLSFLLANQCSKVYIFYYWFYQNQEHVSIDPQNGPEQMRQQFELTDRLAKSSPGGLPIKSRLGLKGTQLYECQ